ncbi:MAG TPA: amidohydrolase, partial [Chitinophagaceae bacterium]|nr:amidohydrolase [Chitinophagaceae bacterium]
MKKIFVIIISFLFIAPFVKAQDDIYPAPAEKGTIYIINATIHVGNGQVIDNGAIELKDGKITKVGTGITPSTNASVIDAKGKQVYPGLI